MPFTWGMGSPSTSTLEVKSGETYVIYNANKVGWSAEVTVSFTAASGDALKILSSEPEQGSKVEKISWDNQVKVTLNKKVKYVTVSSMVMKALCTSIIHLRLKKVKMLSWLVLRKL